MSEKIVTEDLSTVPVVESNDGSDDGCDDVVLDAYEPQEEMGMLSEEELLLERHLLKTRLTAAEAQLKERQDEVFFMTQRMKDKAALVEELQEELHAQHGRQAKSAKKIDELQKTCTAQYSQTLELQYHLRKHSFAESFRSDASTPKNGTEKFLKQKDLALNLIRREKRLKSVLSNAIQQTQSLEERAMQMEDPQNSTVGHLMECLRQRDEHSKREMQQWRRSQSQHTIGTQRSEASWDLVPHKTITTTTEDKYIDCKMEKSVFETQLRDLKQKITPALKEYKDASDKAVTQLWYIFTQKRSCHKPKDEFYKETSALLTKSKLFLSDMLRRVNGIIKDFLREEKGIKEKWRLQHTPECDVACEADIPPPPDPLLDELRSEVDMMRTRLRDARVQTAEREQHANLARDKAQLSLKFLQGKVRDLHHEFYTALHQVYKHRFKWIARLPNPMRTNPKTTADIQHNVQLGAVIDKDIEYAKKFGEYFTSDDSFGVDMSVLLEERERVKAEQRDREKLALRAKGERRRSAPVIERGERERERERDKRDDVDVSRMQHWREKQQRLWEKKKSSRLSGQRNVPYVSARDDTTELPPPARSQSVLSLRKASLEVDQVQVPRVSVTTLPAKSETQLSREALTPPPTVVLSKSSADLFNRIILRRRNLPLRPSQEPTLSEAGYMVEGNKGMKRAMSQTVI